MQTVTLNNGVEMPILGFGVYQIGPDETEAVVAEALAVGYRSIDTAAAYENEEAVGAAIAKSGIPRDELFITTKLWVQDAPAERNTARAFDASLRKLGLDYIDLYLIHQPFGDYYGQWRAMEKINADGRARAIGVSNLPADRLVDLCINNEITLPSTRSRPIRSTSVSTIRRSSPPKACRSNRGDRSPTARTDCSPTSYSSASARNTANRSRRSPSAG